MQAVALSWQQWLYQLLMFSNWCVDNFRMREYWLHYLLVFLCSLSRNAHTRTHTRTHAVTAGGVGLGRARVPARFASPARAPTAGRRAKQSWCGAKLADKQSSTQVLLKVMLFNLFCAFNLYNKIIPTHFPCTSHCQFKCLSKTLKHLQKKN